MEIEVDPAKSARNERKRGLPFEMVAELEWSRAIVAIDARHAYGEDRFLALVPMAGTALCGLLHVPSRRTAVAQHHAQGYQFFRKANRREGKFYEEATADR